MGSLSPSLTLGHAEVDADHGAFIEAVRALRACSDAEFPTLFQELIEHTQAHFAREQAWMEQYGVSSILEHTGEHLRVLGELQQFKQRVDRGHVQFGRAFILERLAPWFAQHVTTMDSAMVARIHEVLGVKTDDL
jgi:hemerythrin